MYNDCGPLYIQYRASSQHTCPCRFKDCPLSELDLILRPSMTPAGFILCDLMSKQPKVQCQHWNLSRHL